MVETRRQQIDGVASALFRERGYAATSVREIARALDLQGASLYAHVASKEEVLWSIIDRAAMRFEAAADEAERSEGGPAERLRALVRAHVGVITDDPGAAAVFVHEWRFLAPERRAGILARRDRHEARFRRLISDGVAEGEFGLVDPAIAAAFILGALNSIATWYRPEGRLPASGIADRYADLALGALAGEASR